MAFDFDQHIDRSNTHSLKWDLYKDRDIIPMWVADMDFAAPPAVLEALQSRIGHGVLGYTLPPKVLNDVVVERCQALYNWTIQPEWIVWLPGLVVGLNLVCRSLGQKGDEVATFTPIYPPFLSAPKLSQRKLIRVPLVKDGTRYAFDLDRLRASVTDRTKILLLCSPYNPVGRAFTAEELRQVADICVERGIVICSDEVHCDLVLDPRPHIPTASLDETIQARTITLMSPSKTFNLPGLNCAMAIIPNPGLRQRLKTVHQGIVPHVNALGYEAALAAYQQGEPWRQALLDYLRKNRDLVEKTITALPGLSLTHIEATYLAWIDARELDVPCAHTLFETAGVGLSEGKDFDGKGFVRLNFGCPGETLKRALKRISQAVFQVQE
jgi:cysteine-S-conjugate beta-lyase